MPPAAISRASSITRSTPRTLISRASSSGSSNEMDAAQWTIRSTEAISHARSVGGQAEAGLEQVAAHRAHARRGAAGGSSYRRASTASSRSRAPSSSSRAHEHHDLLAVALDQARERVHPQKAGGSGEQDRAAHVAGAGAGPQTATTATYAAGEAQPMAW